MTTPGTGLTTMQARWPPEFYHLLQFARAVAASDPRHRPPATNWLEAYGCVRCACGTAVARGNRCRGCGATVL